MNDIIRPGVTSRYGLDAVMGRNHITSWVRDTNTTCWGFWCLFCWNVKYCFCGGLSREAIVHVEWSCLYRSCLGSTISNIIIIE